MTSTFPKVVTATPLTLLAALRGVERSVAELAEGRTGVSYRLGNLGSEHSTVGFRNQLATIDRPPSAVEALVLTEASVVHVVVPLPSLRARTKFLAKLAGLPHVAKARLDFSGGPFAGSWSLSIAFDPTASPDVLADARRRAAAVADVECRGSFEVRLTDVVARRRPAVASALCDALKGTVPLHVCELIAFSSARARAGSV